MIKHIKRNSIRTGLWSSVLIFCIVLLTCTDKDTNDRQGLTVSNLCFSIDGGNASNSLYAGTDWSIEIPSDNPWISVTPSSGSGSETAIPLVFKALVNNNPQSRSQVIIINIGTNSLRYNASQDGVENIICNF